jgi:mono/diheme cytochrome c family protein
MRAARVLIVLIACCGVAALGQAQTPQVARGQYLAQAGDCISCHTVTGGAPFAGGYRLNTPYGYLLAPNITPEPETGIGSWTADDFYRSLHQGVNKQGQNLYPAMPYDFYTAVTREDSDAIYAYLRTVKPVRNAVDVNHLDFPYNQRLSMAAWRELYFTERTYKADPTKSAAWNRGAYLVEGLAHCGGCHSPRNAMGAVEKDKAFTGAGIDGWFALNLTSDIATGLGSWTVAEIVTYLKTGTYQGKTTVVGPMAEVVQNSTSHLTDADLAAMAQYLKSVPADSTLRAGRQIYYPERQRGAAVYNQFCSGCHQSNGQGVAGQFPPLAGNPVVLAPDPTNVFMVILQGVPAQGAYKPMPAFAPQLNDQQIADLVNYLRSTWGNNAPANASATNIQKLRPAKSG